MEIVGCGEKKGEGWGGEGEWRVGEGRGRVSTKGEWVRLVNTSKTSCARNVDTM